MNGVNAAPEDGKGLAAKPPLAAAGAKRGSSGHRRDKVRDKHSSGGDKVGGQKAVNAPPPTGAVSMSEMNGIVRVSAPQTGPVRSVFPASTGPGPPQSASAGPPPSPAAATAQGSAAKPEQAKVAASTLAAVVPNTNLVDERSSSPPPAKKLKTGDSTAKVGFRNAFSLNFLFE